MKLHEHGTGSFSLVAAFGHVMLMWLGLISPSSPGHIRYYRTIIPGGMHFYLYAQGQKPNSLFMHERTGGDGL